MEAASAWGRYVSSLYFVYQTMTTVGYGDIHAKTALERIFSVWAMVLGSFLFGVLVGSVPTAIEERSQAQHRYQLQERNVKEYLQEHKAPADLRGRILQYYEYRFPDRRFYEIEHLVAQLPRSIQEALAVHLHRDLAGNCLVLQRCSAATLSDVCLRLRPFFAARGDVIIHAASEPDGIYLIRSGLCEVSRGGRVLKRLRPGDIYIYIYIHTHTHTHTHI